MTALGLSLLWSALQATILGLVAVLLGARPWRVGGAFTPLVALLCIAIVTVCNFVPLPGWWPASRVGPVNAARSTAEITVMDNALDIPTEEAEQAGAQQPPLVLKPASLAELAAIFVDELKSVRSQADHRWMQSSIPMWVIGVFAIGVAIGLTRLILGVTGALWIRRRSPLIHDQPLTELLDILQAELGLTAKVHLRQANELTTAATMGYFTPAILLPAHWRSWQTEELRAVMCHELAHIHHRDFAAQLLAQIGLVLHFYNPIVHWLSERMKLEQELAADAVAARLAGGQRQYLRVLANLALDHQNHHVGWPARAFLPTRHSFLRRLEMLKVSKAPPSRPRVTGRVCAIVVITLMTIGLITLRPEASMRAARANGGALVGLLASGTAPATTTPQAAAPAAQTAEYELRFLGEDIELVFGARPSELLKSSQLKGLYDAFPDSKNFEKVFGVNASEVEQVVVGYNVQPIIETSMSLYVKLSKPYRLEAARFNGKQIDINGRSAIEMRDQVLWQPDEQSIVMNTRARIAKFMDGRFTAKAFPTSAAWAKVKNDHSFALISGKLARSQMELSRIGAPGASIPQMQGIAPFIAPIIDEAAYIALGFSFKNDMQLSLLTECQDEKGVKSVQETATAAITLLKNSLREQSRGREVEAKPNDSNLVNASAFVSHLMRFATKALDGLESNVEGNLVTMSVRLPANDFPAESVGLATLSARRAAQRSVSMNNMKQLGLAFHLYHDVYKTFPTSAATRVSEKQKPYKYPYSWRVAILPFIEQAPLYEKYKFDEPWDSQSNLELLKQMPVTYRHPDAPTDATTTSYVALTGKGTLLPGDTAVKIPDITDGLTNTIMIVEAKSSIPWTKPEDYPYAADKPLPKLGGYADEGYNVLLGDGSVRFFSKSIDEATVRKMITAQGGEAIR